jgi:hypothetical protein
VGDGGVRVCGGGGRCIDGGHCSHGRGGDGSGGRGLATRGWRRGACSCFQAATGRAGGGVGARRSYDATAWAGTRDGSASVDSKGRDVRRRIGYARDRAVAGAGVCRLGLAAGGRAGSRGRAVVAGFAA